LDGVVAIIDWFGRVWRAWIDILAVCQTWAKRIVVRIFKGLVPFIAVDLIRLAILVAFPAITLWLGSTVA